MKVAAFFAGIGGIELGLQRAGHETVFLCEYDRYAAAVLRSKFGHDVAGDVAEVGAQEIPDHAELLTAGFPCQDLSQAGCTAGINGSKSGVVAHLFRLLNEKRVPWLLIENVSFMLQLDRGDGMRYLATRLEELGYGWAYRVIDSRSFGVPQRRQRVFMLASREEDPARILFETNETPIEDPHEGDGEPCGFYWTEGTRGLGWARGAVPTLKGGSGLGIPSPPAIWFPSGLEGYPSGIQVFTPGIEDAEQLQGFPRGWTTQASDVDRRGHRMRWKLIGNAVTVDAAAWIGDLLKEQVRSSLPDHLRLADSAPWPKAAFGSNGDRFAVPSATTWPLDGSGDSDLSRLVRDPKPLSVRATKGFLSRFRKSQLKKPPGFVESLEAHLLAMERAGRGAGEPLEAAVG